MKESKETMMLPSDTDSFQTSDSSTLLAAGSLARQKASAGKCKGNEPNLNKSVRTVYSYYTLPLSGVWGFGGFFFLGGGGCINPQMGSVCQVQARLCQLDIYALRKKYTNNLMGLVGWTARLLCRCWCFPGESGVRMGKFSIRIMQCTKKKNLSHTKGG